ATRDVVFGHLRLQAQPHLHIGVITHVLTHPGQMLHQGQTQGTQRLLRSHTREHEQVRRGHCPGAEHDFLALEAKTLASTVNLNAYCRRAAEQDATHQYTRPDGEVEAVTAGLEIGQSGAHADAVHVVLSPQTDARGLRVMHVRVVGKVCSYTGAIKGLL